MTTSALEESAQATPTPQPDALLEVRGLTITYPTPTGPFTAVDGVDLVLRPGDKVAVVGESGSGKTNACMAVAGFLAPEAQVSAEAMAFAGADLRARRARAIPERITGVGVVFQDAMTSLDPVWTVGQQLCAVIRHNEKLSRKEVRARAADWLRRVGLHDTERVLAARPYELSGGMRQRVMIAIALSARPRLLIADEPTSALDATLSRELMQLMVELTEELGAALLMVSHDIALCQAFTDRTVVMYQGRVVDQGPSRTLADTATHAYTRGLIACVPRLENADWKRLPTMARIDGVPA
ncbi:ABC transporter ATP-binding protein [Pseudonocardia sp. WMMC193]|uniref:ABC transporter ATP-binding protein n=1 Tax=Pseudonocardia sp. WMMC193 TaxID=2911965 RepID=UPI001F411FF3|nr:ABC transporter ATP-binding protein [Pseudonocardia sp. WMMC193]MCF7553799.1 ABC transporter ATP-binding protein [Pseudonocardia sp. WMMC193]